MEACPYNPVKIAGEKEKGPTSVYGIARDILDGNLAKLRRESPQTAGSALGAFIVALVHIRLKAYNQSMKDDQAL